jgi:ATP-dependent DNA helicase RecQ
MDMYTSVTAVPVKDNIEKSMKIPDATLRVLACTTAFGMGVDCKGVRIVLHWGPPSDIEGYIQEVGRGGRDDETSKAILYFDSKSLKNSDKAVKE